MIRYTTLHIIKEMEQAGGRIEVDVHLVDSSNPYPDTEKIKDIIRPGYQIKGDSVERIMRLLSNKIARYVFKVYPYTLSVKVKAICDDGESMELSLEETELIEAEG